MSVRWDWRAGGDGELDAGPALARAMRSNPSMRVLVISGMYDLATPFFDADYQFAHLGLGDAKSRVELARYKAGHMVYLDPANRQRLKRDFVALVEKTR
jgi:carboxypeptidase C (cathepsin A)